MLMCVCVCLLGMWQVARVHLSTKIGRLIRTVQQIKHAHTQPESICECVCVEVWVSKASKVQRQRQRPAAVMCDAEGTHTCLL